MALCALFWAYQLSSPSSQSSSFIKEMNPAGRGGMVWGFSQTYTSSSLGPNCSSAPNKPQCVPLVGSAQGWGLMCRARNSFDSSCFQEGEEIWTSLGEADPHLEKILGATFMWWFSGVSSRYHLSRRFAVPGNFRDVSCLVLLWSWWAIWKFHPMITPGSGRPFVTTNPRNRFFLHPVCQHSL